MLLDIVIHETPVRIAYWELKQRASDDSTDYAISLQRNEGTWDHFWLRQKAGETLRPEDLTGEKLATFENGVLTHVCVNETWRALSRR